MSIKELLHLPTAKLHKIIQLKSKISKLENQLENLVAAKSPAIVGKIIRKRRPMSAAAKRKIAAAAKARWAKVKASGKRHL